MYKSLASYGNPIARVASLAREQTEKSINTIVALRDNENVPPSVRLAAAIALLDRGWGKPREIHIIEDGDQQRTLKIVREFVHVHKTREEVLAAEEPVLIEWSGVRGNGSNGHEH